MAVTLNANTSTGFIATPDTSGVLQLQTAGTTALTVDASANVGIGTASPGTKLTVDGTVRSTTIQAVNSVSSVNQFVSMTVDSVGANINSSFVTSGNAHLLFSTSNTERMRILGSAPILSLAGGSTTATGTGIAFPATQSASSDVNTLDDYEEGTWTPATSTSGLAVSAISSAFYTKVGRQVTCYSYLTLNNTSGSSKTAYSITGLPFVCASGYGFAREFYNGANGSASAAGDQYVDNSATVANFNGTTIPTGTSLRMVYFSYFAST